jgi:hypothetical protein
MTTHLIMFILGSMFGACALTAASHVHQRTDWKPATVWSIGLLIIAVYVWLRA